MKTGHFVLIGLLFVGGCALVTPDVVKQEYERKGEEKARLNYVTIIKELKAENTRLRKDRFIEGRDFERLQILSDVLPNVEKLEQQIEELRSACNEH